MTPRRQARAIALDDLRAAAREGLINASAAVEADGIPGTDARGQLIRPLLALAGVHSLETSSNRFWDGVLAVQLAHEASLLHDDVIDAAAIRRGEPTLAAARGVARALLRGDHLLTAAYRAAARTGSIEFVQLFARAVERTVAGEGAQGASADKTLDRALAEAISLEKSGELMGCALAIGSALDGADATEVFELGRRIGLFYQMLDDLLDYCPNADTGKPPLADYTGGRWTWVLSELPRLSFGLDPMQAAALLHRSDGAGSPMLRALNELEGRADRLQAEAEEILPNAGILRPMLQDWLRLARSAIAAEARYPGPRLVVDPVSSPAEMEELDEEATLTDPGRVWIGRSAGATQLLRSSTASSELVPRAIEAIARTEAGSRDSHQKVRAELVRRIPAAAAVGGYLAANSRSFRFASRFFTAADAERVARVYTYCRITDDLVDAPSEGWDREELLGAWLELSREAYAGRSTGIAVLDLVMQEMSEADVPFSYAEELVEGMRMDLRGERYTSRADLRRYTYRVASVVGLWLTRLWGMTEPRLLDAAEKLGHAMQLTNILRDVGEDLAAGRLYLPADVMKAHGIEEADLARMRETGRIDVNYRALIDDLIETAEKDYRAALAVLPDLPLRFARAIAASAHIYRGIHAEIRRNHYDNLTRRAFTTQITKVRLAISALWELHRGVSGSASRSAPTPILTQGSR